MPPQRGQNRPRVLAVDAGDDERTALEAELEHEVKTATAAGDLGPARGSDCVIVYPGGDPVDTVGRLRKEAGPEPIVAVVVASGDRGLDAALREAGATEVLAASELGAEELARHLALLARLGFAEARARAAGEAVREAERARDEFVSLVTHELRGDLSTIGLACDVLLSTLDGAEGTAYVEAIERAISRAGATLETLQDMMSIEKRGLDISAVELDGRSILERVARDNAERAQRQGSELVVTVPDEPVVLAADRARLVQALSDLAQRAIAYSRGSEVDLFVEERGDSIVFVVACSGFVIEPDQLGRVFARSWRGPSGDGSLELGAVVARAIAEQHGGWAEVISKPDRGTRFELGLPRAPIPR